MNAFLRTLLSSWYELSAAVSLLWGRKKEDFMYN
jgi:hypothetical protein